MSLGTLKRGEEIRIILDLEDIPTGTPQFRILDSSLIPTAPLANFDGADKYWYKTGVTVPLSGQGSAPGIYTLEGSAIIDGETVLVHDDTFEVSLNNIDDVKVETSLIKTETDKIQTIDNNVDQVLLDIADVPTADEIDTVLSSAHTAGSWATGTGGDGIRNIIFNIKDQNGNNVPDVTIGIHDYDDSSSLIASGLTDVNGNSTEIKLDDNPLGYKVRLFKAAGIIGETENVIVSADATVNLTVVSYAFNPPVVDGLCTLYLYSSDLGNAQDTDINLRIYTKGRLTTISGKAISNTVLDFTWNNDDPENPFLMFSAIYGAIVDIQSDDLTVLIESFTVPSQSSYNLFQLL